MSGQDNPLLPHSRLRELHTAMLAARSVTPRRQWTTMDCAVALAMGLRDLDHKALCTPETALFPALRIALGLPAQDVDDTHALHPKLQANSAEQAYQALGASAAARCPTLLLLDRQLLVRSHWRRLLGDARTLKAPFIVASLPNHAGTRRPRFHLTDLASDLDLPGIPVDGADPVALLRVGGECFHRARAGGGPVVIETVTLSRKAEALAALQQHMLRCGAADAAWIAG